jgi:hypothetical protein
MRQRNHGLRVARFVMLSGALSLWGFEALSALGVTPIASPGQALASKRVLSSSGRAIIPYAQHERLLGNGTTVREFSRADGLVFAVSWEGPVLPDLNELLGEYFTTFMKGVKQDHQRGRRGSPLHLASNGLVVSSTGRMRHFLGSAYAPTLVPAGLEITDILP